MRTSTSNWLFAAFLTITATGLSMVVLTTMYRYTDLVARDAILGIATIGMMGFLAMIAMSWTKEAKAAQCMVQAGELRFLRKKWYDEYIKLMNNPGAAFKERQDAHLKYEYFLEKENAELNKVRSLVGERPIIHLPTDKYILASWEKEKRGK